MIMTFIKGHQTERNSFGFSSSMLVAILFSILLLSCDSPSGPNYKRDKEQRLRVKPVLLVEDELFTVNDVAELIDRSTIRRGGYVAILSTSLTTEDKAAIELRSQFYNKQIEAVHILYVKPHSAIKNTDGNVIVKAVSEGSTSPSWKDGKEKSYFGFDTIEEAVNARDYLQSPFVRFCVSKTIVDVNINSIDLEQVPLFDFTTPVTNDRIQKEFNLTDKEMNFIEDFGKQLNGETIDWSKYDDKEIETLEE